MSRHIVQSTEWGKFRTEYGVKSVKVDQVLYTIHKIPLTNYFYAYAPRVIPEKINYEEINKSLKENKCIAVNFDVPNVLANTPEAEKATQILEKECVLAPRNTFAKSNIILDLKQTEEQLLQNMHTKHRYNVRLAEKKGVEVRKGNSMQDLDVFFNLHESTAERQKYYTHPKNYFEKLWKRLQPLDIAHILTAYYEDVPLASWMLLVYDKVIYYPYGGSSEEHKNLFGSTLVGWEAIKLGKELGCNTFDMWGASENPEDQHDPYYGFTTFKLRYGGKHVTYINSYDYVVEKNLYKLFNLANYLRWKILKTLR